MKPASNKHPSGLTWERWNWPFKTSEEQVLVAQWFRKEQRNEKRQQLDNLEPALF